MEEEANKMYYPTVRLFKKWMAKQTMKLTEKKLK